MRSLLLFLFTLSLFGHAQIPSLYRSLPTYAPNPKIKHANKGPKPNSKVPDSAPARTVFTMTELHPPMLRLVVRADCGTNIAAQDLITWAKERKERGLGARAVDWKDVKGGDVELWIVSSARRWQRKVDLQAREGKYLMDRNRVDDNLEWYVERLLSPSTFRNCIREENLTKKILWSMIFSGLNRIEKRDRQRGGS